MASILTSLQKDERVHSATAAVPREYHWTVDAYYRAANAGVFGHEARLELVYGKIIDRSAEGGPRVYHWTTEQFYRAAAAGVFADPARLELIHGRIIEDMPISPLHADTADYFAQCLQAALAPRFRVREEKPIHIAADGNPTPDLSVVSAQRRGFGGQHPTPSEILLLGEVSVSTAEYDLGGKALLYAQAGIGDYWVALPERSEIVVHRVPMPEGHAAVTRLGLGQTVSPLAASDVTLAVADLLGQSETSSL